MKIDRLLSILALLLENGQMTAPQLAKKMEVARRTITRDVEDLCKAGFPIITRQGAGGGISIAEGFTFSRSLLTTNELQHILVGLHSLSSVEPDGRIESLLQKLAPSDALISLRDFIVIDLTSYYKESVSQKIGILKEGIQTHRMVAFTYYSARGKQQRNIEPYLILFKWSAWYVQGYCPQSGDFRLFKLNRLWDLELCEEPFSPRAVPPEKSDFDSHIPDDKPLRILFDKCVEYRVIEEYGPNCYSETQDGKLLFNRGYTNFEYMLSWILSFGDKATVLEPESMRRAVAECAANIAKRYQ